MDSPKLLLEYKEGKLAKHKKQQAEIEIEVQSGKTSIFNLSFFPFVTNPYKITPIQVRNAILSYQDSVEPIGNVLEKHGIAYNTFFDLKDQYTDIGDLFRQASTRKAKEYNKAAIELYQSDKPSWLFEKDRYGCIKMSNAGVKYMKDKHDALTKQAIIHDRDTYGEKQQIDQRVHSININRNIDGTTPEANKSLAEIVDIFSEKR